MSHDQEKYFYFHVGLLKNSFALEALRQDALKYHMIDQPAQLIALRLTEYYELRARGVLPPVNVPTAAAANGAREGRDGLAPANSTWNNGAGLDDQAGAYSPEDSIVAVSPDVEQNADDAADYWTQL